MDYDVIGDIHGEFEKLEALLRRMGYQQRQGAWRHPSRTAIFVGDFIDRGTLGVETVHAVRAMVDAGAALAVMGNHELNAIAWHTPDPRNPGEYLRPRLSHPSGAKNRHQHGAFLNQVEPDPALHADLVAWFLSLPLWLELDGLRVVHACWHAPFIHWLGEHLPSGPYITEQLLMDATTEPENPADKDTAAPSLFKAVEALTKGLEIPLPSRYQFQDKDGHTRDRVRIRWWDTAATTYGEAALLPESDRAAIRHLPLPERVRLDDGGEIPTFFGHYWMTGEPVLASSTTVCVDYSAANGGPLVAYRWNRGEPLHTDHFTTSD